GALAGMNYMSGNIGRSARANIGYRHDSRFVGWKALLKARSLIRLDFVMDDLHKIESFDYEQFFNPKRRYVVTATNCNNGETLYCDRDKCGNIFDAIKASGSMPFVTPMVDVDGIPCLDGGASDKIPFQWAIDQGYQKIVVIRTRENSFRKKISGTKLASIVYRRHPEFAAKVDSSSEDYNIQCDKLDELSAAGRVFVIAPKTHVTVSRVEADVEKMGALYWEGYKEGLEIIPALMEYLNK
ncbi:MAG: patatin family protein, partial [Erysipelotrichaceae bacterium]|nr:patatin family protein [Erysipelotrichaceae bacterium]